MARLFPLRSDTPSQEGRPRVVDLDGKDADAVFSALSSTTARRIYTRLSEEPGTPSDVADAIDSSIQNVRYHLEKLEDAGLVEVVDTWYSSRGNEMSVYAATDGPLIVTSDRSKAEQLKTALSRFLGGVAGLAGASLLVQYGASRFVGGPETAPTATEEPDAGAYDVASDGGEDLESADGDGASGNGADSASGNGGGGASGNGDDASASGGSDDVDADDGAAVDGDSEGDVGMTTADVEEDDAPDADATDGTAGDDATDSTDGTPADETADAGGDDASVEVDGGDLGGAPDAGADDPSIVENFTGLEGAPAQPAETADTVFSLIPPGALFFLGGLVVLTAVTVYWYWRAY